MWIITDIEDQKRNFKENCIPEEVLEMDYTRYAEFIEKRRVLMAKELKNSSFGC